MRGFTRMVWRGASFLLADATEVDARRLQLADVIVHPPQPTIRAAAELAARTLSELTGCLLVVVAVEGHAWLVRGRSSVGYVLVPLSRAANVSALGSPHSA